MLDLHYPAAAFTPRANLSFSRRSLRQRIDDAALARARLLRRNAQQHRCSGVTGTWTETLFNFAGTFTAVASASTETGLLSGPNVQPVIPANFFNPTIGGNNRALRISGNGVFSTTGTPTLIFQFRLGTTAGPTTYTGTSVGVTAAITTQSGVTNKYFEFDLVLTCTVPGIGTGNCTLSGAGKVLSPSGFASPFIYPIEPTTPDTGTFTATIDGSLTQYLNLSQTWSASSSSNTMTLKRLLVEGLN